MGAPPEHVVQTRHDAAFAENLARREYPPTVRSDAVPDMTGGHIAANPIVVGQTERIVHPQRLEDFGREECGEWLCADAFDGQRDQVIPAVAVHHAFARREVDVFLPALNVEHVAGFRRRQPIGEKRYVERAALAARVEHQRAERCVAGHARQLRQVPADRGIDIQRIRFPKQQGGETGHVLARRPDAQSGLCMQTQSQFGVGHAECTAEHDFAIDRYADDDTRRITSVEWCEQRRQRRQRVEVESRLCRHGVVSRVTARHAVHRRAPKVFPGPPRARSGI